MKRQISYSDYLGTGYNSLERFISYSYQLWAIEQCSPKSVLEIGKGSGMVSDHLKISGIDVTTADIDEDAKPDLLADIRDLPFEDNSFDCSVAFQVLEHIPWQDVPKALKELSRVSKKNIIISIPRRVTYFEFVFKLPFIRRIFKRNFFDISLRFPVKFPGFKVSGQHYWEIDFWSYKKRDFENFLKEIGGIKAKFSPVLHKYHMFYILELRDTS